MILITLLIATVLFKSEARNVMDNFCAKDGCFGDFYLSKSVTPNIDVNMSKEYVSVL